MKILLTGSSGRIGRAIYGALAGEHEVIGIDRNVFSTSAAIGDFTDTEILNPSLYGADAVIHTAGPHAPHVGLVPDAEFERINVEATQTLFDLARAAGVKRFVYTSTTALYGNAITPGKCTWVTEGTPPAPKSIYHRTKLAAEALLEEAATPAMSVRVMRMSRCFPEPAPAMALYRMHRGIDARDVASGHALALTHQGEAFERFILSHPTPFKPDDCAALADDAPAVIAKYAPELTRAFAERGWPLPQGIDRIYDASAAIEQLGWRPRCDWREVLAQLDRQSIEVLPPSAIYTVRSE
ncbi:MAG: NAD(P)-dependent oxidoreductase [Pseudomonadota bacterium]